MEVFVHNLPKSHKSRKVRSAIRKAIKETLFGRIEYEWVHSRRNRACGTITFPEAYMAKEFLTKYRYGLPMLGNNVKVAPSRNPPDTKLVESLRRKMVENHNDSESEGERIDEVGQKTTLEEELQLSVYRHPHRFESDAQQSLLFTSLEYGVWESNGTFGCCGKLERGGGYITYDRQTARLNVEGLMADGDSAFCQETGLSIDNSTIEEILVDRNNARLFLTLSRIPRFWSQNKKRDLTPANPDRPMKADSTQQDRPCLNLDSDYGPEQLMRDLNGFDITDIIDRVGFLFDDNDDQPRFRLPALSAEHAPYAPFSTVYVFNLAGKFNTLVSRLFKSMKRYDLVDIFVKISTVDLAFIDEFQRLQSRFSRYDYRIAFQLESLIRNCFLLPSDVESLEPQIGSLVEIHGVQHSVRLLQHFHLSLTPRTYDGLSSGSSFASLFDEVISRPLRRELRLDPNSVWVHRLDLTPAAFNMEGPLLMGSNRILRLYPKHHDHFLKVSFVEEDLATIRFDRDLNISLVIKNRWRTIFGHPSSDLNLRHDSSQYWSSGDPDTPNWLKQGLHVAGRDFEFLGFSSSSLKEHSAWFISPFEYNGETVTGDSVRSALGKFSHIRCPPLYAARLGQTFTVTSHSLAITPDQVERIEDVSIPDESDPLGKKKLVFSDGVGTMSQSMLTRIWEDTIPKTDFDIKPVVYQIRLGGSKGVLSLDPTLQGSKICLRPSMIKFDAQNLTLELANKGRILPFFLNRQIITLLETLGLERANFRTLLNIEVSNLKIASTDFEEARKLCQRYSLGQTSRFPKILKTLQLWAVPGIFEMRVFRRLLWLALMFALKQIKYRARIAVDNSWTLIGVMDEFDVLNPGEIYVCMKDEVDGRPRYLTGKTLVTRMPALHCGDMQYVNAIGPVDSISPLSALYNCVVFSARGPRPIPNMLSGGDLDGDLYQITQNQLLFPPSTDEPDAYPSVDRKELDRDCTMADIADFFVDFIVNDRTGQISTMHLIHSDKSALGARDPDCITLSRLAAQATDFAKTGHAVQMSQAPRVVTRPKPDFMAERSLRDEDFDGPQEHQEMDGNLYYASQKVLGEMYRSIHIQKLLEDWNVDSQGNEEAPMELWEEIEKKMEKVQPPYQTDWEGFVSTAESMFEYYIEELFIIMRQSHPKPWSGERLKEEEVFLQCIEMDMSKRKLRGRGRYEFLHGMRMEYGDLIERVLETSGTERDRFLRFCACFFVGITAPKKRRDKTGESFAWLVIPELYESYQKLEEMEFEEAEDEESGGYEEFDPYDQSTVYPKGEGADDTLRETMRRFGVLRI